ncbi:MAG: hypothetical protein DMG79_14920, partial [Acidobacteria bacterium]
APGEADSAEMPSAFMSSAVVDEPEIETFEPQVGDEGPKIAVDPMMAEGGGSKSSGAVSFSEMTELPPLKEVYVAPPPPPSIVEAAQAIAPKTSAQQRNRRVDEKPKIQPREVAQKAIKEIKGVPPKLMVYSIAGAVGLILIIGIAVAMYVHSLNSDDDSGAGRAAAVAQKPVQPEASQPAPNQ